MKSKASTARPANVRVSDSIEARKAAGGKRLNVVLSPSAAEALRRIMQAQPIHTSITAAVEYALWTVVSRMKS